jgi:polar amino acid transport system substrate-binding protein
LKIDIPPYAKHLRHRLGFCLGGLVWAASASLGAQEITMVFRDKPPYSYVENGVQRGFLLERTARILDQAGIKANFIDMPPKRIFLEIQNNAQPICSFGWYKIPEREKYARFSQPIHQDKPHLVLAGPRSADELRKHRSLKALLADAGLTLAVVDGVSYGPEIDAMIKSFPGTTDRSLISPLQVARKVALKRADFMFIDQEDYDYLMSTSLEFKDDGLQRLDLPDLPAGLRRYILCSQQVSEQTMARIDAAISRLPRQK